MFGWAIGNQWHIENSRKKDKRGWLTSICLYAWTNCSRLEWNKPVHTIWFDRNWYQRQVCYLKLKQKSFHLTPFSIGKNKNNLDQKKKNIWRTNVKSTTAFLHWLCKQRKESSEMIFSKSVMTALKTQHNWVLVSINSIESSVYHF